MTTGGKDRDIRKKDGVGREEAVTGEGIHEYESLISL